MSSVDRNDFAYLSDQEWSIVGAMNDQLGEAVIVTILAQAPEVVVSTVHRFHASMNDALERTRIEERQALDSAWKAVDSAAKAAHSAAPVERVRYDSVSNKVKLDVALYKGYEAENLQRWKMEVNTALMAGRIIEQPLQVAFAMSKLTDRAKDWAYGKLMADRDCFPDLEVFFRELEATFQPPKCEFRLRSQFLSIKQGSKDLHTYAQEARTLVAGITQEPIDMATQVTVFLRGLRDGPIRTQLFRVDIRTMEEAISIGLQEDFSMKESRSDSKSVFQNRFGNRRVHFDDSRMDLGAINYRGIPRRQFNNGRSNVRPKDLKSRDLSTVKCFRCSKTGHYANECRSPAAATNKSGYQASVAAMGVSHTRDAAGFQGKGTPQ